MPFTIERITSKRYALPLTSPIDLGGTVIDTREGAVVDVVLSSGATGRGDVAPLPGFSPETLDDALAAVRVSAEEWEGQTVSPSLPDLRALPEPSTPSAQFGLQQAVLSALAQQQGVSSAHLLRESPRPTVSLNALLTGTPDEIVAAGRDLSTGPGGYRAVKVKVGRHDPEKEAGAVVALHDHWGDAVSLRLDANRAWSRDEADRFAEALGATPIEYLEEPLADPSALPDWSARTGIPVALDETTRERSADRLATQRFAAAFVIKPSLLGFFGTLRLAERVHPAGVDLVISSAYESGIGLSGLVMLAAALGDRDIPAGLDTYRRLQHDSVHPRLPIAGPQIDVSNLWDAVTSCALSV